MYIYIILSVHIIVIISLTSLLPSKSTFLSFASLSCIESVGNIHLQREQITTFTDQQTRYQPRNRIGIVPAFKKSSDINL